MRTKDVLRPVALGSQSLGCRSFVLCASLSANSIRVAEPSPGSRRLVAVRPCRPATAATRDSPWTGSRGAADDMMRAAVTRRAGLARSTRAGRHRRAGARAGETWMARYARASRRSDPRGGACSSRRRSRADATGVHVRPAAILAPALRGRSSLAPRRVASSCSDGISRTRPIRCSSPRRRRPAASALTASVSAPRSR